MGSRHLKQIFFITSFVFFSTSSFSQRLEIKVNKRYLNFPIGERTRDKMMQLKIGTEQEMEFAIPIAEDTINYWVYLDISEYNGKTLSIFYPPNIEGLKSIYQSDEINGADSLYKECNRPQFHYTVKRGWSNDINGPYYFNGVYHLFYQYEAFKREFTCDYMVWGHAMGNDLLHWQELKPAINMEGSGAAWSGTTVIDENNTAGFGKNAIVVFYTVFDRILRSEDQYMAYSLDSGKTYKKYERNPILNSYSRYISNDTRDPKVLWYDPNKEWVMVLFEKYGMSFYTSKNLKNWKFESHFWELFECPDFFELPVDGHKNNKKWVLHGGSTEYFIGTFNGKIFTPESKKLNYSEGSTIYAAETFSNMPNDRRVQIAWGRIWHPNMPFNQMVLFPTEFSLKTTKSGVRLFSEPIPEVKSLHGKNYKWANISSVQANKNLESVPPKELHIKMSLILKKDNYLKLSYGGNEIINISTNDLLKEIIESSGNSLYDIELLIDRTSIEIYMNHGLFNFCKGVYPKKNNSGLQFVDTEKQNIQLQHLEIFEMKSIWNIQ